MLLPAQGDTKKKYSVAHGSTGAPLSYLHDANESGTSILELVISIQFLLGILFGVLDISLAMREYYFLSDAVSSGALKAMTAADLPAGLDFATGGVGCSGASDPRHEQIHQRVVGLIRLQNRQLSNICILTLREATATIPVQDSVLVQAIATYEGFMPLFDGITISAQARVPYLVD